MTKVTGRETKKQFLRAAYFVMAASMIWTLKSAQSADQGSPSERASTRESSVAPLTHVRQGLVDFGTNTALLVYEGFNRSAYADLSNNITERDMMNVLVMLEERRANHRQQLRAAHMIGDMSQIVVGGTTAVLAPVLVGPAVYLTERLSSVVVDRTIGKNLKVDLAAYVKSLTNQFDEAARLSPGDMRAMGAEERLNHFRGNSSLGTDLGDRSTDPAVREFVEESIRRWSDTLDTAMAQDIDTTARGLTQLKATVEESRKNVDDAIGKLNGAMRSLSDDVDVLKERVAAIDGRVDSTVRLLLPRLGPDERAQALSDTSLVPDAMLCKPSDNCAKVRADMIAFNVQSAAAEVRFATVTKAVENLQSVATIAANLRLGNKTFHKAIGVATVLGTAYLQNATNPLAAAATLSGLFAKGGGSELSAISAQLAAIDRKLDLVLENQRILAGKLDALSDQLRNSHVRLDARLQSLLGRVRLTQALVAQEHMKSWSACQKLFVEASQRDMSGFVRTFGDFPSGRIIRDALKAQGTSELPHDCLNALSTFLADFRNTDPDYKAQAPRLVHADETGWHAILPVPDWFASHGDVQIEWPERFEHRRKAARSLIEPYLVKHGLDWSWALEPSASAMSSIPGIQSFVSNAASTPDRCISGYMSARGASAYCFSSGGRLFENKGKIARDLAVVIDPWALDGLIRWSLTADRMASYEELRERLASTEPAPTRAALQDRAVRSDHRQLEDLLLYVDLAVATHYLPRSALAAVAIADAVQTKSGLSLEQDDNVRLLVEGDPEFAQAVGLAMLHQSYGFEKEGAWSVKRPNAKAYASLMGDNILKVAFTRDRSAQLRMSDARRYGATMFSVADRIVLEAATEGAPELLVIEILPARDERAAVRTSFPEPARLQEGRVDIAPFIERLITLRDLVSDRLFEREVAASLSEEEQTVLAQMVVQSRDSDVTTTH